MEDKPRTDIKQTPLKAEIEAVFNKHNLDEDCDTIARLLSPYREVVRELLIQGNYAKAVTIRSSRKPHLPLCRRWAL